MLRGRWHEDVGAGRTRSARVVDGSRTLVRPLALIVGLVALLALAFSTTASAAPYGQLESWGSFGTGSGQFSSPLMSGVDSSDGSVYVGDLTKESASTEDREFYRIQKLSPTGTVLGAVEIPRYSNTPTNTKIVTLWGVAVDPNLDRFYLLEGMREKETFGEVVAKQILVFSTVPQAGKLVPPAGGPTTLPVPTGANFVNGLFKPRGIQVDPTNGDLVIMAENKAAPKRTLFQRISSTGVAGAKFSDAANVLRPANENAFAFTVGPDGTTYTMTGRPDLEGKGHTRAWEVPQSMASLAQVPGFATAIDAEELSFGLESSPPTQLAGGPEIAISPDGETLFWKERITKSEEKTAGNMLVRGFSLDDLATTVVYGGGAAGACRIETSASGLGTVGEKLVVFDYGPLNEEKSLTPAYGPKVRTFGPGGTGCLAPVAKFKANGSEGDVKVAKGTTVNFDASPSVLTSGPSATPGFRRELVWDFGDGNTEVVKGSGGGEAALTTSHKYDTAGNFTASLQIRLKQPNYGNPAAVTHKVEVEGAVETKFPLAVTLGGTGSGSVASSPGGISCNPDCGEEYTAGTVVKLTGSPGVGSKAVVWSGCDAIVGLNECEVTMSAAKNVTATFDKQSFIFSVTKTGTGGGTVASTPAGINCGPTCAAPFDFGTVVKLTGTPAGGSKAVVWSGCDAIVGSNECQVTVDAAENVSAKFDLQSYLFKVTKGGTGGGTVTSVPAGINCGSTCEATYDFGTVVTLVGTPDAGSKAVVWSGCDAIVGSNECQVTVNGAENVSATFDKQSFAFKVTKTGTGGGTVTSSPAGINCGPTCEAPFDFGTVVKLTGTPNAGSKAVVWSGCDAIVGSNECQVTVDAAENVSAKFDLQSFAFKVTKTGTGGGTVTSSPAGINCGPTCEAPFDFGTVVKLTGTPDSGSKAAVWSGCDTIVGANECQVTVDAAENVTAKFDLQSFAFKVTKDGSGSGTVTSSPAGINCGPTCEAPFDFGTVVKLTGTPAGGSKAAVWSGCDTIVGANECQVTVDGAENVTATFDLQPPGEFALTVTKDGSGGGTVTSAPTGINCGSVCAEDFVDGTVVKLTGTPAGGSKAAVWSGCDTIVGSNECQVTMSSAKNVTATFDLQPPAEFALTVTKDGSGAGTVTSSPAGINCGPTCEADFVDGTVVKLTGAPNAGSEAVAWSGCDTIVGANECQVTMSSAKNVTATFDLQPAAEFELKVSKNGSGSGTVTSSPAGINCGPTCIADFIDGTPVKLTGTPSPGSKAVAWQSCPGTVNGSNECVVTVDADKEAIATFDLETPPTEACTGSDITGEGASLQTNAHGEVWGPGFQGPGGYCAGKGTEPKVTYLGTGSGAGLAAWDFNGPDSTPFDTSRAFTASDEAPSAAQIGNAESAAGGAKVLVIPVAQTAIGVVVNPPTGCTVNELTNKQLESIFRGNIKFWGKIQTADGAGCVGQPITRVVRPDGSGTTFQFKNYLYQANKAALPCTSPAATWQDLEPIGAGNTTWPANGVAGCGASTVSPIATAAGNGGAALVGKVNSTEGGIGYAALPDIEASKSGDTDTVELQNNGLVKLANAAFGAPATGSGNANCEAAKYTVPAAARVGTGSGESADWSAVFGADLKVNGENYPLCTLTYDLALNGYGDKAGFTEGQARTALDYLSGYVTAAAGQSAIESAGEFYAALPSSASAAGNVRGAAQLAASKIGF